MNAGRKRYICDSQRHAAPRLSHAAILHSRTEYEDYVEPERKRHLLRLSLISRRAFPDGEAFLRQGVPRREGARSDAVAAGATSTASD